MSKKVLAKFTPPTKKKSDKEEPKVKKTKTEEPSVKKKSKKSKKGKKSKKSKEHEVAAKVAKKSDDASGENESAHLHIRIAPSFLKLTHKCAEKEDRKHANMIKVILREGLKKRGFDVAA